MTPTLEKPQHMSALDRANEVRLARAAVKNELRAVDRIDARIRAAELIADPPPELAAMRVADLLSVIRRTGRATVLGLLRHAEIPELTKIGQRDVPDYGSLTERQRVLLCGSLLTCCHHRPIRECRSCDR